MSLCARPSIRVTVETAGPEDPGPDWRRVLTLTLPEHWLTADMADLIDELSERLTMLTERTTCDD